MGKKIETRDVLLRLPLPLKKWIEREATLNGSSQNSEIIRSIRLRKEALDAESRKVA